MLSSDYDIYSFLVKDRFGDSGITGLCIINKENNTAVIDSFLMSCRVIGRNIEYVFVDYLVNSLANQGFKNIKSLYKNTKKNKQVENFYDNCSFDLVNIDGPVKNYSLTLSRYRQSGIKYIEVKACE